MSTTRVQWIADSTILMVSMYTDAYEVIAEVCLTPIHYHVFPNADDFNNLATKFSFYREFSSQFLQTSIVSQHTKAKLNGNLVSTQS